jgi:hypothetical protein
MGTVMPKVNIEVAYKHMEKHYGKDVANQLLIRNAREIFELYHNAVEVVYAHATSTSRRKEKDFEFHIKRLSEVLRKLSDVEIA